jgi:hypothetical protein
MQGDLHTELLWSGLEDMTVAEQTGTEGLRADGFFCSWHI